MFGAVSMWGRVVEHERGARAEFAYPARLRLVCAKCLRSHIDSPPTVVCEGEGGAMTAVCARHDWNEPGRRFDAKRIEAELLATYGVDLQPKVKLGPPVERVSPAGTNSVPFDPDPPSYSPPPREETHPVADRIISFVLVIVVFGPGGLAVVGALVEPFLTDRTPVAVVEQDTWAPTVPDVRIKLEPRWRQPPPVRISRDNPFLPEGGYPWT